MLKSLLIRNFVLIDKLDICFDNGFSVITGETGAGKSIILGALSLVLGERADSKSIRAGSDKCVIEATFDVSEYNLKTFFEENDLEYDDKECILRRELYNSGKSRAFINDSPAQLAAVRQLGNKLIDIHSQHQNLLLADSHFQLNVVDLIAGTSSKLADYRKEYKHYIAIGNELAALQEKVRKTRDEEDYLRFQCEELKNANLRAGEQSELEHESDTLSHTEEIKTSLYKVTELLNGENSSVVQSLKEALSAMEQLVGYFPKAAEYVERLRSAHIDMSDLAADANILKDDVEFDPERLAFINERLNTLYSLQQKHHLASIEELMIRRDDYISQLDAIDNFDEELKKLTAEEQNSYNRLLKKASEITTLRSQAARQIEKKIVERMILLGIPNAQFRIEFAVKSKPASDGIDDVNFLFSANKNEQLKPVSQTASGGEISRLMLCVKAMISGYTSLPSIIFDEIDTGISGEIADKMALIMKELGERMQVLAITHLPQIAAKGKSHFYVYKEDSSERTFTHIRQLSIEERINEIARMLSGSKTTKAAVENAKELIGR